MKHCLPSATRFFCSGFFCLAAVLSILRPASGQVGDAAPVRLQRLSGAILLDGRVDEAAWEGVEPFRLTVQNPTYRAPLSQPTEIRVAYDDEYLYLSCRCHDSDSEAIRTGGFKRDDWNSSYDQVGLILDTFSDNENALVFVVSALGVRSDVALYNDGNMMGSEFPMNLSWNTFWDAETSLSETGWSTEARIPFSSLKFGSRDGVVSMGLIAYRYIAREREFQVFPDIPPNWGFTSLVKPSRAQPVQFENLRASNPIYITPYVLGGVTQEYNLNDDGTAYVRDDDISRNLGLDLKYGLTRNLTVDLTVNTDFAQVEADDEQVNLTRFSLFFPEKRRFFQERSSNFDFKFGDNDQVFYSRRIGLDEDAEERIPLIGGLRVVGRVGVWDVGLMSLQSARNPVRSSENYGVLRLRRQVLNPFSYLGGILTSQASENGSNNMVAGLDGIFRLFGDDYLLLNVARSFDSDQNGRNDSNRFRALWEKRRYSGPSYTVMIAGAGKDYNPALGFEQREDFTQFSQQGAFGWLPGEDSPLSQHQVVLKSDYFVRNADRKTDTHDLSASWSGMSKKGAFFQLTLKRTYDSLTESFELSDDIDVEIGDYTFTDLQLMMMTSESRPVYAVVTSNLGTYYGGGRTSIDVQPTWIASRFVTLSGAYVFNRVDFPDKPRASQTATKFRSHIARFRAELTLNRSLSASAFIQYNGADDISISNVRVRYNPREGNDLYLVFNQGYNMDRRSETPHLPLSDGRTLIIKYAHTFQR